MSAKTIKRLVILIAVFGLVGVAGFFSHGLQVEKLGRSVLKKAERTKRRASLPRQRSCTRSTHRFFPRISIQSSSVPTRF